MCTVVCEKRITARVACLSAEFIQQNYFVKLKLTECWQLVLLAVE